MTFLRFFLIIENVIYLLTLILKKGGLQMKRNLSIRLNEETITEIEKIAKTKKRKRGDMIRIVIERYVEEFKV